MGFVKRLKRLLGSTEPVQIVNFPAPSYLDWSVSELANDASYRDIEEAFLPMMRNTSSFTVTLRNQEVFLPKEIFDRDWWSVNGQLGEVDIIFDEQPSKDDLKQACSVRLYRDRKSSIVRAFTIDQFGERLGASQKVELESELIFAKGVGFVDPNQEAESKTVGKVLVRSDGVTVRCEGSKNSVSVHGLHPINPEILKERKKFLGEATKRDQQASREKHLASPETKTKVEARAQKAAELGEGWEERYKEASSPDEKFDKQACGEIKKVLPAVCKTSEPSDVVLKNLQSNKDFRKTVAEAISWELEEVLLLHQDKEIVISGQVGRVINNRGDDRKLPNFIGYKDDDKMSPQEYVVCLVMSVLDGTWSNSEGLVVPESPNDGQHRRTARAVLDSLQEKAQAVKSAKSGSEKFPERPPGRSVSDATSRGKCSTETTTRKSNRLLGL